MSKTIPAFLSLAVLSLAASVLAMQPAAAQMAANPAPGCKNDPAVMAANKKLGMAFFRPGITMDERLAMLDAKTYIQHNPVYVKYAKEHGTDEHDTFKALQSRPRAAPLPGQPPGDPLAVVTAECDFVTIVHKTIRPDPVKAGEWVEAYNFDTFRVRGGKFVEHWDNQVVTADNPPPVTPK